MSQKVETPIEREQRVASQPLPDAVHVGFSKCASTFLQAFFRDHPDIFLVEKSHFFSPFDLATYRNPPDDYRQRFEAAAPQALKLESDEHIILPVFHPFLESLGTTLEAVSEVSGRIRTIQPRAKILIVIRNQVELILSRYSEYVLGGGTHGLHRFVSEFLECSRDGVNYYQNYYYRILEIFQRDFPQGHVLMMLQEQLQREESESVAQLCKFLGISSATPRRSNLRSRRAGLSPVAMSVMRVFNRAVVKRPARSYLNAEVRGPDFIFKNFQRAIRVIDHYLPASIKGDKRQMLSPALEARIRAEFEEDNRRLANHLEKDLSGFGYY